MEDQKTQIVEKRLSKAVIRRRVRTEDAPAASQPVVETPPVETAKPAQQPASVAKIEAAPAKVVATASPTQVQAPAEPEAAPAKAVEQAPVSKPVAAEEQRMVTEIGKEVIRNASKIGEKERTLSFKDRIIGTISLDRLQPQKRAQPAAKTETSSARPFPGAVVPEVKEKEDPKKAAKVKKGVKLIGGDLDIEGMGRSATLTHLTRTVAPDRIFRPDALLGKKKIIPRKKLKQTIITEKKASKRVIEMAETMTVGNLAQQLGIKASEIIAKLMNLGLTVTINQTVDRDTATMIATDYEYEIKDVSFKEGTLLEQAATDTDAANLKTRPPVVTIMGHVDHGKTSLLDAIRATNVTAGEAGGITQHIGAYTVPINKQEITFLDTPGHEAFTAMRARGAKVTDIVILVVAADDGLMPQTEESIAHAKAAGVPIVVAINKIDKPEANPDKVLRELSEKGILAEEWGGDVQTVRVSAKTKQGLDQLLEALLLQSEVLELKGNAEKRAKGVVLEAKLDKFKGAVCTLLVQDGTLKKGDIVVAGTTWGKIKAMSDWKNQAVQSAAPSHAVEVLGLESVPEASEAFHVVATEQDAKQVVTHRLNLKKAAEQAPAENVSLEDMFAQIKKGDIQEFNILLKTDVHGSLEAIRDALLKLGNQEIKTKIIHAGVGGIRESDVQLAVASKAAILGFNVRPETGAIHLAKQKGVDIKLYKIIYEMLDEVKQALQGLLAPDKKEIYLGRAEVRQAFKISKFGTIAGSMVVDGKITRTANLRLLRDNVVLFEGKIASLKRFKDDAREVAQGFECGIGLEGFEDIKEKDIIEAYQIEEVKRTL